jgi:GH24 family phage-related lysozyme (muramidase)
MRVSQKGIDLIKKFEGLRLTAYVCPAGVLTIGYGHTGSDVKPGMKIDEKEAESAAAAGYRKRPTDCKQFRDREDKSE